jgi:DNA-binding MarR family transcriptional regulator
MPRRSAHVKIHDVKSHSTIRSTVDHALTRDEVDLILDDWRRERPDLDVSPLAVMSRLSRLARKLDRERGAVFSAHGLEGWGFDVLAALRRSGPPYELPPRELLVQNLVSSGAMTNRIDRLEEAGLVSRRPDSADRRGVLVRLSAAGLRRVDACVSTLATREQELLRPLGESDCDMLANLLRRLLVSIDESP